MVGVIFAICCKFQKIILTDSICTCLYNLEYTLCQSSGLIKYGNLCFTQKFQIVTSFYKDTCLGCSAVPLKKLSGLADDLVHMVQDTTSKSSTAPYTIRCAYVQVALTGRPYSGPCVQPWQPRRVLGGFDTSSFFTPGLWCGKSIMPVSSSTPAMYTRLQLVRRMP